MHSREKIATEGSNSCVTKKRGRKKSVPPRRLCATLVFVVVGHRGLPDSRNLSMETVIAREEEREAETDASTGAPVENEGHDRSISVGN